ncbi:uncharacterized protein LOC143850842 isoform X2 [Tasmannia lanceolata]|uniref:uncharacterized protein LOC143850842 isoform X2 n=1 Tax=Tasmannia lanceolata TaxID=3420 RepID=UPI00406311C2
MICISGSFHDYVTCDSPAMQFSMNLIGSLPKCLQTSEKLCNQEIQSTIWEENGSDHSFKSEAIHSSGEVGRLGTCDKSNSICPYRFQLEQDVEILQQQLHEEMQLRVVLENAVDHAVTLSTLSCLPPDAQELLSNIATMEVTVSKLEQQMVSLHFQLSQERNERRLVEYRLKHSPSQSLYLCSPDSVKPSVSSSFRGSNHSISELHHTSEEVSCQKRSDLQCEIGGSTSSACSTTETSGCATCIEDMKASREVFHHIAIGKLNKNMLIRGLWNNPNQLSEEMVRCMKNIFISLADSSTISSKPSTLESLSSTSPPGHLSNSSLWSLSEPSTDASWVRSPQVDLQCSSEVLASENVFDPYKVRGKLSWADIGSYGLAIEVSWMSVGKKQLEYAAGTLRRFRSLVEQLAKVNPAHMSRNEKLAFWINLYNALIMHAYLAYGVPRSELKLFSLMQKAAYTVGGHSFNAASIEYAILKMKPPLHRPQTALLLALHKLKISEEQKKFSIDDTEPLAMFALSCGMYSSPAVRIYTPGNVEEELQEAQRDFVRASVGVSSKGKLLVPKMLHCFARGFVDDANLAVWISHFLPPQQAVYVEKCISERRQSFLSSRNCGILSFDSHFRYLLLPEIIP